MWRWRGAEADWRKPLRLQQRNIKEDFNIKFEMSKATGTMQITNVPIQWPFHDPQEREFFLLRKSIPSQQRSKEAKLDDVEVDHSEKCKNGHVETKGGEESTMPLHLRKRAVSRKIAKSVGQKQNYTFRNRGPSDLWGQKSGLISQLRTFSGPILEHSSLTGKFI